MISSINTTSLEEVEKFLEEIKSGDVYQIVSRKHMENIEVPYILNFFRKNWFESEENSIVLILDKTLETKALKITTIPIPFPIPKTYRRNWTQEKYKEWCSYFLKVLYEDQICLIHAGWLERIK